MNEILRALKSHRSIRRYKPDPIPEPVLESILDAGLRGSSSGNLNSWSVIVTTNPELKEKLFVLHHEQEMVRQAPTVLTFCADFRRTRRWVKLRNAKDSFDDLGGYLVAAFDAVIAAQNVAVAAESLGLGICYMGSTVDSAKEITTLLKIPESVIPVTSLVIGTPDEDPAVRAKLPLQALVHQETYQDPSDAEILETYREREISGWHRYQSIPAVMKQMERLGIKDLATYYTSEAKYSKTLHTRMSRNYFELLQSQGFWNF